MQSLHAGAHQARPHAYGRYGSTPRLSARPQAVPKQGRAAALDVLAPSQDDGQLQAGDSTGYLLGQGTCGRLLLLSQSCCSTHARGTHCPQSTPIDIIHLLALWPLHKRHYGGECLCKLQFFSPITKVDRSKEIFKRGIDLCLLGMENCSRPL